MSEIKVSVNVAEVSRDTLTYKDVMQLPGVYLDDDDDFLVVLRPGIAITVARSGNLYCAEEMYDDDSAFSRTDCKVHLSIDRK